ncbi:MAG TPA: MgtC/SapB family protein [Ensifer sp.]|nr:MgtC/SapB family protein [Ensifer sp.]
MIDGLFDQVATAEFLPWGVIFIRLILAMICGAVVGLEREWRNHSAGLRTHILVSLSAAVMATIALELAHSQLFEGPIRMDPMRLMEAVTNGVAFLAAGMIAFTRGRVVGLTTGAGMWLAGAIGLSAGLGLWRIAMMATAAALIILWLMRYFEKTLPKSDKKPEERQERARSERRDEKRDAEANS